MHQDAAPGIPNGAEPVRDRRVLASGNRPDAGDRGEYESISVHPGEDHVGTDPDQAATAARETPGGRDGETLTGQIVKQFFFDL